MGRSKAEGGGKGGVGGGGVGGGGDGGGGEGGGQEDAHGGLAAPSPEPARREPSAGPLSWRYICRVHLPYIFPYISLCLPLGSRSVVKAQNLKANPNPNPSPSPSPSPSPITLTLALAPPSP